MATSVIFKTNKDKIYLFGYRNSNRFLVFTSNMLQNQYIRVYLTIKRYIELYAEADNPHIEDEIIRSLTILMNEIGFKYEILGWKEFKNVISY